MIQEVDLGKLDTREEEGIFMRYATNNKAYQCYNKTLNKIVESTNVNFCEEWGCSNYLRT